MEIALKDKNVVTLQDISCFGKCSITVALPVISAMGLSCAVIPTAVLSTHTGGFKGFTFRDLTDDIPSVSEHWQREGLSFDGIYTGYLGSRRQIGMIIDFIESFRRDTLIFVDPAMADHGKLYTGFDMDFVSAMRELCSKADIIVPNITEAAMMLGCEYKASGYDEAYIHTMLRRLCDLGCRRALLTGVSYDSGHRGCVCYDRENDCFESYFSENIPVESHGTGDVFASSFFGALMLGKQIGEAMKIAVDFTVASIRATLGDAGHWYGVKFEKCLPGLIESVACEN
ncbi:MAG: pyridoxamine kinase [Clostridia bacterium]|nr:pyridoxamine kinase [Clostridia bacterium]